MVDLETMVAVWSQVFHFDNYYMALVVVPVVDRDKALLGNGLPRNGLRRTDYMETVVEGAVEMEVLVVQFDNCYMALVVVLAVDLGTMVVGYRSCHMAGMAEVEVVGRSEVMVFQFDKYYMELEALVAVELKTVFVFYRNLYMVLVVVLAVDREMLVDFSCS